YTTLFQSGDGRRPLRLSLHSAPLGPCQEDDRHIQNGEGDEPRRGLHDVAVDLVDAERGEHADRPRERPQLFPQQRIDEDAFHDAMRRQIDGGEALVLWRDVLRDGGVMREMNDKFANRARREDEQQNATDQLEQSVQTFENDADLESDVNPGAHPALVHSVSSHVCPMRSWPKLWCFSTSTSVYPACSSMRRAAWSTVFAQRLTLRHAVSP